ncbi:hypothetical protein J3P77_09405 [Pseudomonas sp. R1-18]|uniref:hypothetical protein n=1 Tax=Pseudomonas sp. R1-18 TaxID=1632772 RepID=UPI003DA9742C
MEVVKTGNRVFGRNGIELGYVDEHGLVWSDNAVVFRIVRGAVYSAHDQYLGKLEGGIGVTSRGQILFSVEGILTWG